MTKLAKAFRRNPGAVIVYAASLLALLGVLATALLDSAAATVEAAQIQVFQHMARYAADSGIEYAIGCLESELSNGCNPVSSPWCDAFYANGTARPPSWIDWADPDSNSGDETIKALHPWAPGGGSISASDWLRHPQTLATATDDERVAARYVCSARISMQADAPAGAALSFRRFDYRTVYLKVATRQDAFFVIRSRGQVRVGEDPNIAGEGFLMANVNVVQKIRIGPPRACTGQPRIERISYDILPGVNDRANRGDFREFPKVKVLH